MKGVPGVIVLLSLRLALLWLRDLHPLHKCRTYIRSMKSSLANCNQYFFSQAALPPFLPHPAAQEASCRCI